MTSSTWSSGPLSSGTIVGEQTLERRALLFDRIMEIPQRHYFLRNTLIALWYPCFDAEAIDLALRNITQFTAGSEE